MKDTISMIQVFEGYVRNYRRLNIHQAANKSQFTKKEIEYFSTAGEYLGLFPFVEDTKPNHDYGRSRPMDLSWWKWDERIDTECFTNLVLHLERENIYKKDMETIDKLFCSTEDYYVPDYVIGIMNIEKTERIKTLQEEVKKRNKIQNSECLMIYRYWDKEEDYYSIFSYYISHDNKTVVERKAISDVDNSGYWYMSFEEEY